MGLKGDLGDDQTGGMVHGTEEIDGQGIGMELLSAQRLAIQADTNRVGWIGLIRARSRYAARWRRPAHRVERRGDAGWTGGEPTQAQPQAAADRTGLQGDPFGDGEDGGRAPSWSARSAGSG